MNPFGATDVAFRPITESDAAGIQSVALEAWRHTYAAIFDSLFIEEFVRKNYAPETTVSLLPLVRSGEIFFEVAVRESAVVGFCNIRLIGPAAQLQRFYLRNGFRRVAERDREDEWHMGKQIV